MTIVTGDNVYGPSKWIVDPVLGQGTHQTIQAAIDAASSGDTVIIRSNANPYTENLTGKDGITLTGFIGNEIESVVIKGKVSISSGMMMMTGLQVETNGDYCLEATGSGSFQCFKCRFDGTDNDSILNSGSGAITMRHCTGVVSASGIRVCENSGSGSISFRYTNWGNSGGSTVPSIASGGGIRLQHCEVPIPFSTSSTGIVGIANSIIDNGAINIPTLTHNSSNPSSISNSSISSGTASDIVITSGTVNVDLVRLNSTNVNAVTGAGTLNYGLFTLSNSTAINATSTSTNSVFSSGISFNNGTDYLDEYEEGSWTPVLGALAGDPTVSYTTQEGRYTRVGDLVTVKWSIVINTTSGGSGAVRIRGLPFTVSNDTAQSRALLSTSRVQYPASAETLVQSSSGNTTILLLLAELNNASGVVVDITDIANGDFLTGTISYWV